MAKPIIMPQVGQDIDFAKIIEWHIKVGDEVKEGDAVATIESDKASFEVEASESGTVLQILFNEGDEAAVLKPIAYISQLGKDVLDKDGIILLPIENSQTNEKISSVNNEKIGDRRFFSSPSVRRIAREKNLNLSQIPGSGPQGRIIKKDVENFLELLKSEKKGTPVAKKIAKETGIIFSSIHGTGYGGRIMKKDVISSFSPVKSAVLKENLEDQVVFFPKAKKRAAERLSFSKQTIPHYYIFTEVDVTKTLKWRKTTNINLGIEISINDIIIKSTAGALKKFPEMNSWVDDDKMLIKTEINIGVAVSTPTGLLVPVIPGADRLNLIEINNRSRKNAEDARQGVIHLDKPGTFTISNLGMYGISRFLAIINPPECAILSVGAVGKKVIPKGDEVIIIDCITLGLSCDHRAVDGVKASEFLNCLKEILENYSN